ncbi:unnamed protein product [Porites evermanni]|uniref:Ribosomal protein L7Ae/L30e/S12e/Gadd45 domain-containing protein n=1 Tax=Porites evermanni TaxID=104178 RepID=A0ABN8SA91_9CNID|nr:unnamed protein product [Porites evermanni]
MTDIWDSARGSDIWELVEYPDPSSVQYSTMSPFQGQPENNSILISSTNSDTAVSTASFSTWDPDVLANDCTDSDISSDHEMHSNSGNDDDSDWEDVTEDSGYCRFQSADPVAEMLDSVVQSGVLPREHIFYKLVSGALEYVSYDHSKEEKYRWDPTLDKRTHTSSKPIDFSRFGIPLPSKRTLRCNKPGFTTPSGIIRNLLTSILRIADSQNACCYVNSSTIKAIAISLMRDGLGLKPSLEFHERKKVLVGSTKKIDIDYVRKNPAPNPSELKQSMIKDADISVVTTVDRKTSLPIGVYYEAAGQTGEEVLAEVEEIGGHLQTSYLS